MVEQDPAGEVGSLRRQVAELQKLAGNLTEAASHARNREMSWVYAMEGNRDGVWDWNAQTNEVFFSPGWKEMLGFAEHEIGNELAEWDKRIHPDDRDAVYADLNRHLGGECPFYENEHRVQCRDGSWKWILDRGRIISWTDDGKPLRVVGTHTDIQARKLAELESERLISELRAALEQVRVLKGLLPLCSSCKRVRDDKGYWTRIEKYISEHSDAEVSHAICPECARRLYPELF